MRLAACTASGAAFLALTGCGGAVPDDGYAGPPPSSYDRSASAPVLMGQPGPARPSTSGLAGGPRGFTGMAPIPNPGDLSRADRVKFYGHKYDYLPEPKGKSATASGGAQSGAPRFQLVTRRKADGTLQISMRPIANPEDMTVAERRKTYGNRYAPRAVAAAPRRTWRAAAAAPAPVVARPVVKPATVRATPAPVVKPAPRPVATAPLKPAAPTPVAPTPAVKPAAPVVAAAPALTAPKLNPTQRLQAAVSAGINRGASLSVPADLKAGKEANVVLSLPGDLLAMVQEQAAKLSLGKAARKVNAYANLKGDGYAIDPPGQQTTPVAAGKPTTFSWKVKPAEGEKTPLTADYGLELNGAKPKTAFSVGTLQEAVAAPVDAAKSAAKGFKMPKFSMPSLKALAFPWVPEPTLPVVGKVARENMVGGALAVLALILLLVLARGASANRARAERRRKFRTMQDYGVNEPEPEAHHTSSYVNPMIAAAAGAAGGYALASHGHDDHGHGHDDHGHDDHGHDDHAAHGHDDHAHGHDDHGAHHTSSHDTHGHDDHGHGHDDHAAGHDEHGHAPADGHGHDAHGHDGHHAAHTSGHGDTHGHDDGHGGHGHGHEDGHDDHGGHDDGHGHGHDDHGHGPAQHISHGSDHGHGHDDHAAGHDDHGHGHDDPAHGHDEHHKEPEHAHH